MSLLLPNDGRECKVASSNPGSNTPTEAPMAPHLQTCLMAVGAATPQALVAFSHAALFSPALSTLITALAKAFLLPMPGLTLANLCKYPPKSVVTIKGHLDQICKNLRSTKTLKLPTAPDPADEPDALPESFPSSDDGNPTIHYCYAAVVSPQPTGQVHSDQTGRASPSTCELRYYETTTVYSNVSAITTDQNLSFKFEFHAPRNNSAIKSECIGTK
jgi:hypothetical protein